jgi:rhodanese-related sulfurtransferase
MKAFLLPALFLMLTLTGCAGERTPSPEASSDTLGYAPESDSVVYVDVRRLDEYEEGHVASAIHIPVEELEARLAELDPYRNNTLAIYCRSGKRAAVADSILQSNGFAFTRNAGGLDSLRALGVPIEEAL